MCGLTYLQGRTILFLVCRNRIGCTTEWLEHIASLNTCDPNTPVLPNDDDRTAQTASPLMAAVAQENMTAVRFLLKYFPVSDGVGVRNDLPPLKPDNPYRLKINMCCPPRRTQPGRPALMFLQGDNTQMVQTLLEAGADPDVLPIPQTETKRVTPTRTAKDIKSYFSIREYRNCLRLLENWRTNQCMWY